MARQKRYWLQRYILPPIAAYVAIPFLHLLLFTCRMRTSGANHFFATAEKKGCFLALWHDSIPALLNILYRQPEARSHSYAAVMSKSRDADVLAAIAHSYPQGDSIRISHNARHVAATQMMNGLEQGKILLITPDGPKGPARKVKLGTAFAALHTNAAIVPISWTASRCWTLPTWDKMRIPKPFSRIEVVFGPPIYPQEKETVRELTQRLQTAMEMH